MRMWDYILQEVSVFTFRDPKFSYISPQQKVKYMEKALKKADRKHNKILAGELKRDLKTLRKVYGRSQK